MPTVAHPAAAHVAEMATAADGEAIRLTGWFEQINDSVRALLFGELLKRAQPIEHYPSDLYHDAHWIAEHVTGAMTFYWAARTWGSDIGTDRDLVAAAAAGKVVYRVELTCDRGEWSVAFTSNDRQD
jgi:hypothetical protein